MNTVMDRKHEVMLQQSLQQFLLLLVLGCCRKVGDKDTIWIVLVTDKKDEGGSEV